MSVLEALGRVTIVIPAAGRGMRMGGDIAKQYVPIGGKPLLQYTLERLLGLGAVQVILVLAAEDEMYSAVPGHERCTIVEGGVTRADSVANALRAMTAGDDEWVLVHDGARPCVREHDIKLLVDRVRNDPVGGLLAVPVFETVKRGDSNDRVLSTVSRDNLWLAQTPQLFRYGVLKRALAAAKSAGNAVTDEASAVEQSGLHPVIVGGHRDNIKVTTREDLALAAYFLAQQASA